jgi:hypothetical protein
MPKDYTPPGKGHTFVVPDYQDHADGVKAFEQFADSIVDGIGSGIDAPIDRDGQVIQALAKSDTDSTLEWKAGMSMIVSETVPEDSDGKIGDVVFVTGPGDGGSPGPSGPAPGLVHLHTEPISNVSSISVDNVFSTDYDSYLIRLYHIGSEDRQDGFFRLRKDGVDDGTGPYEFARLQVNTDTGDVSGSSTGAGASPLSFGRTFQTRLGQIRGCVIDVFEPARQGHMTSVVANSNGSSFGLLSVAGTALTTTQFDGFTLGVPTGTFQGTVYIYGYLRRSN